MLGTALAYMSDDMLNLAVPSVARDLGATVTDVQWILNAYYVALVSGALVAGSMGDIIGHRRIFVGGILLFSVGAVGCALAPTVDMLVLSRFVQGIGAAMLLTAGLALISRLNSPEDRNSAVGQFLGLVAALPAVGPLLSGALIELLSWRWLFVLPLVLPTIALVVTRQRVPETPRARERSPDVSGALLAFLTLGAFSVALITGALDPIAPTPMAGLTVAVLAGVALVRNQRRSADPMLPLRLLRRRTFLGANLVWLVACMTSWGAVFFVAVMLQATLGQTPVAAGLLLTPIYLVMMVGSPLIGRLADRIGPRWPVLGGLAVYAWGLFLLSRLTSASSVQDVLAGVLVMAVGMAIFSAPLATVAMSALDEADQGVASAFNNFLGQLAGLLAIVLLPAASGLAGIPFGDPRFALGYGQGLLVLTVLAAASVPLAAWSLAAQGQTTRDAATAIQG